mgnify:CR=1 FL=1
MVPNREQQIPFFEIHFCFVANESKLLYGTFVLSGKLVRGWLSSILFVGNLTVGHIEYSDFVPR